ncbi:MAG: GTP 3',8-cyclase MoaA [Candidatus Bathyarchaeia archaeon]
MTLLDRYGRPVMGIRIALTQRCNLRCIYCHREGEQGEGAEMAPEEISEIVRLASGFGIRAVKLTGGEPLLRDDIVEIVGGIKRGAPVGDLSMTTNGTLLAEFARDLRASGLDRVNVSLDTLDRGTYERITGSDRLGDVLSGIEAAVGAGLSPVKLNMVVMKGINDEEVWSMVDFAKGIGAVLQLIELEALFNDEVYEKHHADLLGVEEELEKRSSRVEVRALHHRRRYLLRGGGEVEVGRPMHNSEFCMNCKRIRVTSDGKLKPCLMRDDNLIDLIGALRNHADQGRLREAFIRAVELRAPFFMDEAMKGGSGGSALHRRPKWEGRGLASQR